MRYRSTDAWGYLTEIIHFETLANSRVELEQTNNEDYKYKDQYFESVSHDRFMSWEAYPTGVLLIGQKDHQATNVDKKDELLHAETSVMVINTTFKISSVRG